MKNSCVFACVSLLTISVKIGCRSGLIEMQSQKMSRSKALIATLHLCIMYVHFPCTVWLSARSKYKERCRCSLARNTSLCNTNQFMVSLTKSASLGQPTTALTLRLSKKPPKSSFLTSTTQCSKLSILTLALVSWATSSNAFPNLFFP